MNRDYKVIDEEKIFSDFKNKSEKAFSYYFKIYYSVIVKFCESFIYDTDKSKSIAQEAFIKLWLDNDKIEKPTGVRAFLFTVAKSKCLNLLRHQKVVKRYKNDLLAKKEEQLNIDVLNSMDFNTTTYMELEKLVQEAVVALPNRSRQAFIMSRMENKKYKEIAEELGISVKAVESNISRALLHLRRNLSEYLSA